MSKPTTPIWTPGAIGTEGCQAYWLLHEGSGSTVADISGNGRYGTLGVGATWEDDGGPVVQTARTTGHVTVADPPLATSPLSVLLLVRRTGDSAAAWDGLAGRTNNTSEGWQFGLRGIAGDNRNSLWANVFLPSKREAVSSWIVPTDRYCVVGLTHDGSTLRLWADGSQVGEIAAGGAIAGTANPLYLGSRTGTANTALVRLGVAAIWSRALPSGEIAALTHDWLSGTFAAAGGGGSPVSVAFPASLLMGL